MLNPTEILELLEERAYHCMKSGKDNEYYHMAKAEELTEKLIDNFRETAGVNTPHPLPRLDNGMVLQRYDGVNGLYCLNPSLKLYTYRNRNTELELRARYGLYPLSDTKNS